MTSLNNNNDSILPLTDGTAKLPPTRSCNQNDDDHNSTAATVQSASSLRIPPHAAHKVCTASDAVSLISRGDTLA